MDISDQLLALSTLAYLLLVMYRKHGSNFITKDLYMDTQSCIQGAFIVAAWFKKLHPNRNCYLVLLGTDQLENLFSIDR